MTDLPEMTVTSLILHASPVVQFVMAALVLASLTSWAVIVSRSGLYRRAEVQRVDFEQRFWSGLDMQRLYDSLPKEASPEQGSENLFRAAYQEFLRMRQQRAEPDATMQAITRALRIGLSVEQQRLEAQLSFLASVGSVSPYVGLFGTVWGIMTAFLGLAQVQQATLAVVAPGIAEALIATAIGLFAAIPAVIAYNRFTMRSERLLGQLEIFAEELSSIFHRETHARAA